MALQTLDPAGRKQIHALIRSAEDAAKLVRAATQKAEAEQQRREAEAQQLREEQAARERELDAILANVLQGLAAIIELGRTKEMKKLAQAREVIGKSTHLFSIGDEEAHISVDFAKDSVELRIWMMLPSSCQGVGKPTHFVNCELLRRYPLASRKSIGPGWFWHIFYADLTFDWSHIEFDNEDMPVDRAKCRNRASEWDLRRFASLDIDELSKEIKESEDWRWREDGPDTNSVLLRFLADCSDYEKFKRYVDSALHNLR